MSQALEDLKALVFKQAKGLGEGVIDQVLPEALDEALSAVFAKIGIPPEYQALLKAGEGALLPELQKSLHAMLDKVVA